MNSAETSEMVGTKKKNGNYQYQIHNRHGPQRSTLLYWQDLLLKISTVPIAAAAAP